MFGCSHARDARCLTSSQAAPAMYRAKRPQLVHRNVTCDRGGGGECEGSRSMGPEHDGQLNGFPLRSLAMRCSAWAGLYVFGRGLRMLPPDGVRPRISPRLCKVTAKGRKSKHPRTLRAIPLQGPSPRSATRQRRASSAASRNPDGGHESSLWLGPTGAIPISVYIVARRKFRRRAQRRAIKQRR